MSLRNLKSFEQVVFVTGAGISAASGLKTYRETGSRWSEEALERMSRSDRYGNHLAKLWPFWSELRRDSGRAEPNRGHEVVSSTEARLRALGGDSCVITQNVDGLHGRAGSKQVVEIHGSIHRSRCIKKCSDAFFDAELYFDKIPVCKKCGRPLRVDVTLFGEVPPGRELELARKALLKSDLCVYVGTSGEVQPASDFVSIARKSGAYCVLVNKDPWRWPHPDFHETLLGDAGVLLEKILG